MLAGMKRLAIAIVLLWIGLVLAPQQAAAQYLARPLTLPQGKGRIDVGPPDYGYMDHGSLNNGRGLRLTIPPAGDTIVTLGAGAAYGITSQLEVGGLLVPLELQPDSDLGDLEAYLRYAFARNLAIQGTLRIPTETDLGIGVGMPIYFDLGGGSRMETGFEVEMIFFDDAVVHLDFPMAFQFALGRNAFAGPRTGLWVPDLEDVAINLGGQIGVSVSSAVDLSASMNFPLFLWTGPGDAINVDWLEVILAASFYL